MEIPDVPVAQITRIAFRYWPLLPPVAKGFIDPEDLIQAACLHWYRKAPQYDPTRASWATFTHRIALSAMQEIRKGFLSGKHPKFVVPVEELRELPQARCFISQRTGAEARVNRLFELATPGLQTFLRDHFYGGEKDFKGWNATTAPLLQELRWLIPRIGLTADDFRATRAACAVCWG